MNQSTTILVNAALVLLFASCSGEPDPVRLTTQSASASEGGRLLLTLNPKGASSLTAQSLPTDFRAALSPDGQRAEIRVPYDSVGEVKFTLTFQVGGVVYLLPVETTIRPLQWQEAASWVGDNEEGPEAREYPSYWIDAARPERLLMFGGFGYVPTQFTDLSDYWELNLDTGIWSVIQKPVSSPTWLMARVAPVYDEQAVFYLGGLDSERYAVNYVLKLNYATTPMTWSAVDDGTNPNTPIAPVNGAFIYDAPRDRYLNVCGYTALGSPHCDVHAFYPQRVQDRWEQLEVTGPSPAGRVSFAYGYDEETQRLIIFSGEMGTQRAQDTWALELAQEPLQWVKLAEPNADVPGRRNPSYALDPLGHRLFVWGGTANGMTTIPGLYALDLHRGHEVWRKVQATTLPLERTSGIGLYDAPRHRILVGFGNGDAGEHADLWALNL